MDRRDFFRFGLRKGGEALLKALGHVMKATVRRSLLRPPGALSEESFLLACTRCGDCRDACPHGAILMVDVVTGGAAAGTPYIDPYHQPCLYCQDMPCVAACEPGALRPAGAGLLPRIGVASVALEHCLVTQGQYCDYCFGTCPTGVEAISRDKEGRPRIDAERCVGCGNCAYICVSQTGKAITVTPL